MPRKSGEGSASAAFCFEGRRIETVRSGAAREGDQRCACSDGNCRASPEGFVLGISWFGTEFSQFARVLLQKRLAGRGRTRTRTSLNNSLLASDFDQTLSFNDSGVVLSELIGFHTFHDNVPRVLCEHARKSSMKRHIIRKCWAQHSALQVFHSRPR